MRENHKDRINFRKEKWIEQHGICEYCKSHVALDKASLDHIIPVDLLDESLGKENLVMCCKKCNKSKGNHIIFVNLFDKEYYHMVNIPYFFQANYIQKNFKDKK